MVAVIITIVSIILTIICFLNQSNLLIRILVAELFDFCCANGRSIVGVSLGTIRTFYSNVGDVGVKITCSERMATSQLFQQTAMTGIVHRDRERPTKRLFIQQTESMGSE